LHEIGRAFGKDHGSIQFLLSQPGGIVPDVRRRSQRMLTLAEREDISRGIASGSSIREIARGLERAASTVSREVARHGGRPLYRASEADHQAWKSAFRPGKLFTIRGRQVLTINTTVNDLFTFAYSLQTKEILNAPSWMDEKYDVNGVPDVEGQPDIQQMRMLMQDALGERFGLKFHTEQREMSAYALIVLMKCWHRKSLPV
jgi:hypothetical protein